METKTCTHCGELKPISCFRKYYGGRKGHYRYCKTCEKLNTRHKYLVGKGDAATQQEREELAKLIRLYELRETLGLETPLHPCKPAISAADLLEEQLAKAEAALHENV